MAITKINNNYIMIPSKSRGISFWYINKLSLLSPYKIVKNTPFSYQKSKPL